MIVQLGPSNKELSSPFRKGSFILCFSYSGMFVGLASPESGYINQSTREKVHFSTEMSPGSQQASVSRKEEDK